MTTSTPSRQLTKADFKVPALLVLLSLVPMFGGIARLANMSGDTPITEENARFVASPLPIGIHIVVVTLFSLIGAFQFSPKVRARWPGGHRKTGRVLAVSGLLAGLTGLWMTHFYAIPTYHQGPLTYWVRLAVGLAMVASIVVAWAAILRRDVPRHEAFMIRAYALGQGAGTQVLLLLPWMLISGESEGFTRDVLLTLSWVINAIAAEVIIRRRTKAPQLRARAAYTGHNAAAA